MSFEPTICISDISDHLPFVLSIKNLDPYKAPKTKIQTRKLDIKKITTINDKIKQIDWNTVLEEKSVNDSFNTFHEYLNNQLNETAPIATIEISSHKLIRNEWVSTGLMKCMTKQKKLYKKNTPEKQHKR